MTTKQYNDLYAKVLPEIKATFPEITNQLDSVQFKLGRATKRFGTAQRRNWVYTIRLSRVLCDTMEQAEATLRHEFGHIVDYMLNPHGSHGHGPEWKRLAKLCGSNGERCSSIVSDTAVIAAERVRASANGGRGRKCQVYECSCKIHKTGRKLKHNGVYHTCNACKGKLRYHGAAYSNDVLDVMAGKNTLDSIRWIEKSSGFDPFIVRVNGKVV